MDHEYLYRGLKEMGLLYDPSAAAFYGVSMEYSSGFLRKMDWFCALPLELRRKYGLCISLNGMKFTLAAENFQKPLDTEAVSAAVCFVLAGCILDNMLDEGSPGDQASAREKLTWEYCARYFIQFDPVGTDHAVDRLYGEIASFLRRKKKFSTAVYDCLMVHMRRAVQAETFVPKGPFDPQSPVFAADKSVLFTVIGFELALYGEHTEEEWEAFFLIGDIFRIIDDLCDAEQDMLAGRTNSLLTGRDRGSEWIGNVLEALRQAMTRLESLVSEPFFAFLRHEVQCWTLSNACLYQKMLEVPLCRM